jgi:hypothetical protein
MTRSRKLALAVLLLIAAAAATAVATRTGASERGALSRLSNDGRPIMLENTEIARRLGAHQAVLLAVRGGRAYYRVEGSGGTCYATGQAGELGTISAADCPRGVFPETARPVLDFSVYEATTRGRREVSLYRAEGIAADGVAAVAFLRPDGTVALTVPVRGNVFAEASPPHGLIAGIVALDATGRELWRSP